MSNDSNARFNTMIEKLKHSSHPHHTVKIHDLLESLRHSGTRVLQDSGQSYTYVSMEDVHQALVEVINAANLVQSSPIIISDTSDFINTIESHLGGIKNAQRLEYTSRGCADVYYLGKVYLSRDTLISNIAAYQNHLANKGIR